MGRSFWCAVQSHRRARPYKDFLNQSHNHQPSSLPPVPAARAPQAISAASEIAISWLTAPFTSCPCAEKT